MGTCLTLQRGRRENPPEGLDIVALKYFKIAYAIERGNPFVHFVIVPEGGAMMR